MKKIHVVQRENAIINRLNKTREERYPDLKSEKDDALRQLRRKDQAGLRERVCPSPRPFWTMAIDVCSKKRRLESRRRERNWRGRRIMPMMICIRKSRSLPRAIKTGMRISRTTSCNSLYTSVRLLLVNKVYCLANGRKAALLTCI